MGFKQRQGLKLNLRTRMIILISVSAGMGLMAFLIFFGYFSTGIHQEANASTNENFSAGSFIINMGVTPQTNANGLLPYGMIYELNNTYNVPVKWVIEPSKVKDGADFIHNGITYKGGTFIIAKEHISTMVANRIEYWRGLGVSGNYSVSGTTVPVYTTITAFPRVMIDNLSGNDTIISKYFTNAFIPASSYEINSPANLNACHDIWINPHGDPTWATHNYLYNFVTVQKSYIWMQCHAVSMMEYCSNPVAPFTQLNYLTTNGLKCYQSGKCGTNPEYHTKNLPGAVTYYFPTDPVMQFMGTMSSVSGSGSEKWFVPMTIGGWRTSTKRLAVTGTYASPQEGVIMVYGPAFGDTTNGLVMYAGGHDMNGGSSGDNVSAQRSFFNFLFLAGKHKAPALQATVNANINANATDTFAVSVSGGTAPYSYSWSSNVGGIFSAPNDSVTEYTAFHTMTPWPSLITCVVTDACGRRNFFSQPLLVNGSALPISLISFTGQYESNGSVSLKWKTASEINNNYFTLSRSANGKNFTPWKNVPSQGNGNSIKNYSLVDTDPLPGLSFYRLNQTDFDGIQVELGVVTVQQSGNNGERIKLSATPNPFQEQLTVNFYSENEGPGIVRIWSVSGKLAHEQHVSLKREENKFYVELPEKLPKGTYLLRVFYGAVVSEGIKIIKN